VNSYASDGADRPRGVALEASDEVVLLERGGRARPNSTVSEVRGLEAAVLGQLHVALQLSFVDQDCIRVIIVDEEESCKILSSRVIEASAVERDECEDAVCCWRWLLLLLERFAALIIIIIVVLLVLMVTLEGGEELGATGAVNLVRVRVAEVNSGGWATC